MKHKTFKPELNKINWNGNRDDIVTFKSHGNTFKHPFSIFIDFESTLSNNYQKKLYKNKNR